MNKEEIKALLEGVKNNKINIDEALEKLEDLPFKDLGFAKIDTQREIRVGYPEVIYCEGKTVEQVRNIVKFMYGKSNNILGTRASEEMYNAVKEICEEAEYNKLGRTITIKKKDQPLTESYIAIVAAGTSDLPVVEEAFETAKILGNKTIKIIDVGVAGIHRLFSRLDVIRGASVLSF